jgi:hypothetical protein
VQESMPHADDVELEPERAVSILAVGVKHGNKLIVGGEELNL